MREKFFFAQLFFLPALLPAEFSFQENRNDYVSIWSKHTVSPTNQDRPPKHCLCHCWRAGRGSARLNQRKMAPRVSAPSERVHGRRLVRRGLTAAVCCITLGALDGEATVSLSAGAHRAGRTPPGAVATCAPLAAGPAGVLSPASVEELAGILPAGRLQQLTRLTGRPVCRTAPVSASALALCQQPVPSR